MIPPESSGASRTKVAWCNLGVRAVEVARTAGCWSVVRRFARPRRGARPARRLFPLPPRPAPPPTGHDSPPAPPRAVTSRRPDPGHPTPCDHSTPHTRHVLTTHGPPRSHELPLPAPPCDSSRDLGETHAARRATSLPHLEARPASASPLTTADRSRRTARRTPRGHVPSAGPRPTDDLRPLDAPHAARPDHPRTAEVARTAARSPTARQFMRPRRSARGASCDRGDLAHARHRPREEP